VNLGAIVARTDGLHPSSFVAAKRALLGPTREAAVVHAQRGLRCNAVALAFVRPLQPGRGAPPARSGATGEATRLVSWLCSRDSALVTGAFYPVDGGYLTSGPESGGS
jgi:NAD(P)-dependent dehydrogenase (short-subunit alcohol dehydrogenase family)